MVGSQLFESLAALLGCSDEEKARFGHGAQTQAFCYETGPSKQHLAIFFHDSSSDMSVACLYVITCDTAEIDDAPAATGRVSISYR